ncbi:flavin reductase family protein [Pseudodonghicola flavimaris]|uniref:Flavin reductase family protein n=1 Tax=Pseudodonghicola flavimaris TaxID=3050036 RepID=A0ABT7F2C6_9RHOB|nr:flavin reductase family protein [Pseudodonghicola flavimaris]MDK3018760.1 flavin reductase family protein [Pseudodonghicola flavimaris]
MGFEAKGDAVDIGAFWRTLGERAIGATVVTTAGSDGPNGFLGLSAAHVCANPPTMLVSVDKKTSALQGIEESGAFAVNFLPAGTAALATAFGGKGEEDRAARFAGDAWGTLATGAPVHAEALGVFDCRLDQVIDRGTVAIVIGLVEGVKAAGAGEPLVFFRGKFLSE